MQHKPTSIEHEVRFQIKNYVAIVTLNRPDKRNAVNGAVTEALTWCVAEVDRNPQIRAAILASSHPTVFCAGADLAEISAGNAHLLSTSEGGFGGFAERPREKPWIAAIDGAAFAGGCELAVGCDMIVASTNAQFGIPEVKRGLIAGGGGLYRLARMLPRNLALELIATGDPIKAERAYALGMVNILTEPGKVLDSAFALAERISGNAPLAVVQSMHFGRLAASMYDTELRASIGVAFNKILNSADAKEGPLAFLEKRAPLWTGA